MDEDLKNQAAELFESLGMDIPTAIRVFFKRALVEKGLPFDVKVTPSKEIDDPMGLLSSLQALIEDLLPKRGRCVQPIPRRFPPLKNTFFLQTKSVLRNVEKLHNFWIFCGF